MSVDEIIFEEPPEAPADSQPEPRRQRSGTRAEWIKFVILCLVMGGAVIVVALSRPYIFNQVIPAVLGDFNTPADAGTVEEEESDAADEPVPDDAAPDPAETDEEAPPAEEDPADEAPPEAEEGEAEQPTDAPTAVPNQIHTVAAGETLSSIARQYGVTLDALIAANEIVNPNRVLVGDQLVIPQP